MHIIQPSASRHLLVYSPWHLQIVDSCLPVLTLATPTNGEHSSVPPHPVDLDLQICPHRFQDNANRMCATELAGELVTR